MTMQPFIDVIAEQIGKPISNVAYVRKMLRDNNQPRPILIRAFAGGIADSRILGRSLVYEARRIYVEASRTMDIKILLAWVSGGGRGTKRSMRDNTQVSKVKRRVRPQ